MKKLLPFALLALTLAGCGQAEQPAEPLSPQAQEALKTGNTGIPGQARQAIEAGPPAQDAGRAADAKRGP